MTSRVSRHPRFSLEDDDEQDSESEGPPAIIINDEGEAVARNQVKRSDSEREASRDATERRDGSPPSLGRAKGAAAGLEEKDTTNSHSFPSSNLPSTAEKKDDDSYPPEPSPQHSPSRPHSHDGPADTPVKQDQTTSSFLHRLLPPLLSSKLNWKGIRPAVRASVAAWCGLILILHPTSQSVLGQASFLCLVGESGLIREQSLAQLTHSLGAAVSIISPAALPIASALETSFFQFILVAVRSQTSISGRAS